MPVMQKNVTIFLSGAFLVNISNGDILVVTLPTTLFNPYAVVG